MSSNESVRKTTSFGVRKTSKLPGTMASGAAIAVATTRHHSKVRKIRVVLLCSACGAGIVGRRIIAWPFQCRVGASMRILWVAQWFPPDLGALPARITEMANVWAEEGHDVTVLTAFPHHPLGEVPPQYRGRSVVIEQWGKVRVIRCWSCWRCRTAACGSGRSASFRSASRRCSSASGATGRPDVVLVSSPPFFTIPAAW